jgi:hypothetical protein
MFRDRILLHQNLDNFNFAETKKNVSNYFRCLEDLKWEHEKLNARQGLANHDISTEHQKQQYIPIGKDVFNLSAKEDTEKELEEYISSYCWAMSVLSDKEQLYIEGSFINQKCESELVGLLEVGNRDSNEYRKLKRSAVYKFADFLDLLVLEKTLEKGGMRK